MSFRILTVAVVLMVAACGTAGPADGDVISWGRALEFLYAGEVESVVQLHSLEVILTLKDGRSLSTVEPGIDVIFDEIQRCGEPCADILVATE